MAKAADKQRRIKASLLGHDTSRTETIELRVEADSLVVEEESPGVAASALEFALEGLHLSRRLNKDGDGRGGSRYEAPEPGGQRR